jgi:hypothetical protein
MSARDSYRGVFDVTSSRQRSRDHAKLLFFVLLGPVVALIHQGLIYMANSLSCGRPVWVAMQIVSALAIGLTIYAGVNSHRFLRAIPSSDTPEAATVVRTKFMARLGMLLSALSGIVVLAEWLGVIVFPLCKRS